MRGDISKRLDEDGFFLAPSAVEAQMLSDLMGLIDSMPTGAWERRRDGTPFAVRNAHLKIHGLLSVLKTVGLVALAEGVLGKGIAPVSATIFDKPEGAKWSVPAHQDVVHPLSGEARAPGFENWSVRNGVAYARLPQSLLSSMISLRLHCDDCTEQGALQVLPGTHRSTLPSREVMDLSKDEFVSCPGAAGSVLLMKPQLVHRSGPSGEGSRRRVLHVTFAAAKLPDGLSWTWSDGTH